MGWCIVKAEVVYDCMIQKWNETLIYALKIGLSEILNQDRHTIAQRRESISVATSHEIYSINLREIEPFDVVNYVYIYRFYLYIICDAHLFSPLLCTHLLYTNCMSLYTVCVSR